MPALRLQGASYTMLLRSIQRRRTSWCVVLLPLQGACEVKSYTVKVRLANVAHYYEVEAESAYDALLNISIQLDADGFHTENVRGMWVKEKSKK